MHHWVWAVIFILQVQTAWGQRSSCPEIYENVSIEIVDLPSNIQAGEMLRFSTRVAISDRDTLGQWKNDLKISLVWSSPIRGSRSLITDSDVYVNGLEQDLEQTKEITIPPNFQGEYNLITVALAFNKDGHRCYAKLIPRGMTKFIVENHSPNADIHPPIVSQYSFDKPHYSPGDTANIAFSATDLSKICLSGSNDRCEAVNHVQLSLDSDGSQELNFFPAVYHHEGDRYYVRFEFPKTVLPGNYRLRLLNVSDIYGNTSAVVHEDVTAELR